MRKSAPLFCALLLSLSARRAWIEIGNSCTQALPEKVALRKESVDRNQVCTIARGLLQVALRKESVDRNINSNSNFTQKERRSPQGERG